MLAKGEYDKRTKPLLTYLNVADCVLLSVIKWADFKFVLLLNVSYRSRVEIKYNKFINYVTAQVSAIEL